MSLDYHAELAGRLVARAATIEEADSLMAALLERDLHGRYKADEPDVDTIRNSAVAPTMAAVYRARARRAELEVHA